MHKQLTMKRRQELHGQRDAPYKQSSQATHEFTTSTLTPDSPVRANILAILINVKQIQ